jgi:hypothetical protein
VSDVSWRKLQSRTLLVVTAVVAALAGLAFYWFGARLAPVVRHALTAAVMALSVCFMLLRLAVGADPAEAQGGHRTFYSLLGAKKGAGRARIAARDLTKYGLVAAAVFFGLLALVARMTTGGWGRAGQVQSHTHLAAAAVAGLIFCLGVIFLEIRRGAENHRRSLWLIASATLALSALLAVSYFDSQYVADGQASVTFRHPRVLLVHTILSWLMVAVGWVIALGWMANPNALSMHLFYKSRLTRAYLGASNFARRQQLKEVTEAVEGDDLSLAKLKNCQRGGPYHLINTTLNMSAGRDLTTAQRSSAMFVLSKRACGSARTGYRATSHYMSGRMTLGTAVAVSGAAASPNMGSRTPSASLAMLMTLLNVRLGYWAPTPNKDLWDSPQAQLWPFYVLREFLSQTNDLSSYCYLTDGGHFDNTGVYSLVERGCRYIVLADCGADPRPCFSDLGDVIRRCRIDFDARIKLDIEPFIDKKAADGVHFIVGEIKYSPAHLSKLGWTPTRMREHAEQLVESALREKEEKKRKSGEKEEDAGQSSAPGPEEQEKASREKEREKEKLIEEKMKDLHKGRIVVFKPAVRQDVSADVRQYGIENPVFPQQGTSDQWFDEAQFESYRQLGYICARRLTDKLGAAFNPVSSEDPLSPADVDEVFDVIYEKHRPKDFESPLLDEFNDIMNDEARERRLDLTAGCRQYLVQTIADGAAKLRGVDNFSLQAKAAKDNLRELMRILGDHVAREKKRDPNGMFELHERTFLSVTRRLTLFPFFEGSGDGHEPGGDPGSNGDPGTNGDGHTTRSGVVGRKRPR